MIDVTLFTEFDWDFGNSDKNWNKHNVSMRECEEVFNNRPRVITDSTAHYTGEQRYFMLSITNEKRKLAVVFTIRGNKIRIISARDQNQKRETGVFESEGK